MQQAFIDYGGFQCGICTPGQVLAAKAWNVQRRGEIGRAKPSDPPSGFDYDMWVGPARKPPFQSNRHHYTWHWWRLAAAAARASGERPALLGWRRTHQLDDLGPGRWKLTACPSTSCG